MDHRPQLIQRSTEPILQSASFNDMASGNRDQLNSRASAISLIDLVSFADSVAPYYSRPSTVMADSLAGSEAVGANPFELETHASICLESGLITWRKPSIYETEEHVNSSSNPTPLDDADSDCQPNSTGSLALRPYSLTKFADMDPEPLPVADSQLYGMRIKG